MRHVAEFRPDGYSILHPLSCRPRLHDCPVQRAARHLTEPPVLGRAVVEVDHLGDLQVLRPATDADLDVGPDPDAMLTALRAVDVVEGLRRRMWREVQKGNGGPVMIDARTVLADLDYDTAERAQ
jgi:hypothetical protein